MKENLLVTTLGGVVGVLANLGPQVLTTLLMGMVGALGGLIIKEVWNWIKRKYGRNKV